MRRKKRGRNDLRGDAESQSRCWHDGIKEIMFCVMCRGEIDGARVRRGAVTCSDKCSREVSRQRRQATAEKKCRLCGRKFRNRQHVGSVSENARLTTNAPEESVVGAVREAHNDVSGAGQIEAGDVALKVQIDPV